MLLPLGLQGPKSTGKYNFKSGSLSHRCLGILAVAFVFLRPPQASLAQCTVQESVDEASHARPTAPPVSFAIDIDKVSFKSITADAVQFEITLGFTASRGASARQILVSDLRLNDMPLYASPITSTIQFDAGKRVDLPGPVPTTVYFRDLENLRPFDVLLSESRLRVQGTLYIDLELNLLEKVALFSRSGRTSLNFTRLVPFEFPGGAAMREIARRALSTAAETIERIESGVESTASLVSEWRRTLWQEEAPAALMSIVRFNLKDSRGRVRTVECAGSGFRLSDADFLLPGSLVEPWKYDPELAAAVQRDGFTVEKKGYDIWVWPAGARLREEGAGLDPDKAFRLSKGQLRIAYQPRAEAETLLVARPGGRPRNVKLLKREGPANLALLEFVSDKGRMRVARAEPSGGPAKDAWNRIAVFRFPAGAGGDLARPDLVLLSAERKGTKIALSSMIDYSGWGAPLISPEGVIGIVQSASTAISLEDALLAVQYVKR